MFILISVTRESMDICVSFYPTRNEAYQAMLKDILISTRYNTVDEVRRDAESGKCGLTDEDAWAETFSEGTCAWKIVEVPEETNMVSHTALDKEDENAVDANGVSLAEKKAFLCETFGNGICEKAGADFYEFAYRAVKELGMSLMDIDRWAFLNTIFGYDIGADVARRISAWYEENGMDVLELADLPSLYHVAEMELGIRLVYDEVPDTPPAVIQYDWSHKEGSCSAYDFESDQEDDFNTEYATWIIAYCPDTDEFFATNQRGFFWQYTEEFASEKDAVTFFEGNVKKFISVKKEIRRKVAGDHTPSNRAWLSNTNKMYTEDKEKEYE